MCLYTLQQKGLVVQFMWVESHVGIHSNEIVDHAAHTARYSHHVTQQQCTYSDLFLSFMNRIRKTWISDYQQNIKGSYYKSLEEKPPKNIGIDL
ncbi:hypothetical protein WA026_019172 [Henosepilachna vigintioctopunctata]|uniref:RNase H type-1 domain-containing protein n=1 Tax=Henosepilachna vigintioctopunctata TaxID=420089 RepID=A0AAW1UWR5_9CUCU